jgi:N-acetylglucosamine-6-phosphate deacetylase
MAHGTFQLGTYDVIVDELGCRLSDGTIAGSVLSLNKAIRNLIDFTGCEPGEALRTVTATPAALLGFGSQKGQITPGFDADMVLMTKDFEVSTTIVNGNVCYSNE